MSFRLILLLLLVLFEGAFIGFNLGNACDVWLFKVYEAVPVYITVLISFAAGVLLSMLFFAFGRKRRRAHDRAGAESASSGAPRGGKGRKARESRKAKGPSEGKLKASQEKASSPPPETGTGSLSSPDGPDSYGGGLKGGNGDGA